MQTISSGEVEVRLDRPSGRDGCASPSAKDVRKSLNKYSFLLAPGILAVFLGVVVYPPLDFGPLLALSICVFLLPLVLQLVSILRKRLAEDAGGLRRVYVGSGFTLALLGLLLLLNGRLDVSPRTTVRATVTQKTITRGKSGSSYTLTVSSWRPGRTEEEFWVAQRAFDRAVVGKTVTVELHKGYFGLPWSGRISPE
jgi:hypothetical protein